MTVIRTPDAGAGRGDVDPGAIGGEVGLAVGAVGGGDVDYIAAAAQIVGSLGAVVTGGMENHASRGKEIVDGCVDATGVR